MPRKLYKRSLKTQFKKLKSSMRDVVGQWEEILATVSEQIEERKTPSIKAKTIKRTKRRKIGRVAVKYRDKNGNTWTGRGRPARWLVEAEKAGKKRASFLV
jgi:DNA-binding protein H-NS